MRQRSDLITYKEFNSKEDLLKFLNELDKKYNLTQIIVSINKDIFGRYEIFYKDYSLAKPEDRLP